VVEAGRNGMYATAVVDAVLLAVAAYSLWWAENKAENPKPEKTPKKTWQGSKGEMGLKV
jgi:hypothetical protein